MKTREHDCLRGTGISNVKWPTYLCILRWCNVLSGWLPLFRRRLPVEKLPILVRGWSSFGTRASCAMVNKSVIATKLTLKSISQDCELSRNAIYRTFISRNINFNSIIFLLPTLFSQTSFAFGIWFPVKKKKKILFAIQTKLELMLSTNCDKMRMFLEHSCTSS